MTKIKIRSRYDEVTEPLLTAGLSIDPKEKITKDSEEDETDINSIMDRYRRTGLLPQRAGTPTYADLTNMPMDYMELRKMVDDANAAFMALPATVREECGNNPAVFLDRVADPTFRVKHGLDAPPPASPNNVTADTPDPSGQPAAEPVKGT